MKSAKRFLYMSAAFTLAWIMPSIAATAQTETSVSGSREGMVISQGAEIVVRTNEAIDSTTASDGRKFSGTVEQDVKGPAGQVSIPKGSPAELTVSKVSSGGTTGSPEVALALHSIDIGGHRYLVNSADVQQGNDQGIGKNKRTGEYIGGGAASRRGYCRWRQRSCDRGCCWRCCGWNCTGSDPWQGSEDPSRIDFTFQA
jgi:hypothetical protein